jgi:hypothetical protein
MTVVEFLRTSGINVYSIFVAVVGAVVVHSRGEQVASHPISQRIIAWQLGDFVA